MGLGWGGKIYWIFDNQSLGSHMVIFYPVCFLGSVLLSSSVVICGYKGGNSGEIIEQNPIKNGKGFGVFLFTNKDLVKDIGWVFVILIY
jgi:hypothetical protein